MSEKEVELLLFDEGFLANRDVWNACESLEIQVCISIPQPLLKTLHSNAVLENDGGSNRGIEQPC
jgi:hypothetical protein